ncbi:hypothetical protein ACB322_30255, partial [Klebsiella pneumoniae]
RKNRACAFLAGFRVVCCLFYRFPVRNALRPFLRCVQEDVMVNPKMLAFAIQYIGTQHNNGG